MRPVYPDCAAHQKLPWLPEGGSESPRFPFYSMIAREIRAICELKIPSPSFSKGGTETRGTPFEKGGLGDFKVGVGGISLELGDFKGKSGGFLTVPPPVSQGRFVHSIPPLKKGVGDLADCRERRIRLTSYGFR